MDLSPDARSKAAWTVMYSASEGSRDVRGPVWGQRCGPRLCIPTDSIWSNDTVSVDAALLSSHFFCPCMPLLLERF